MRLYPGPKGPSEDVSYCHILICVLSLTVKSTTDHNKEMVSLLKDLQSRVVPVDQQQIQRLLDLVSHC